MPKTPQLVSGAAGNQIQTVSLPGLADYPARQAGPCPHGTCTLERLADSKQVETSGTSHFSEKTVSAERYEGGAEMQADVEGRRQLLLESLAKACRPGRAGQ